MRVETIKYNYVPYGYDCMCAEEPHNIEVEMTLAATTAEANSMMKHALTPKGTEDLKKLLCGSGSTCECRMHRVEKKKKCHFGGAFEIDGELVYIEKVIYNNPAVIVFWSDGTKTKSRCADNDEWNPEFGLNLAVLKKFIKTTGTENLYKDWGVDNKTSKSTITLKDIRKNAKEKKDAQDFVEKLASFSKLAADAVPTEY